MIDYTSLMGAIERVEAAIARQSAAQTEHDAAQAAAAELVASGDSGSKAVSELLAAEARQRLLVSKIRNRKAEAHTEASNLRGVIQGMDDAARADAKRAREECEARVRTFINSEPCLPCDVQDLVARFIAASVPAVSAARHAESIKLAAFPESDEQLLNAARTLYARRPITVPAPQA